MQAKDLKSDVGLTEQETKDFLAEIEKRLVARDGSELAAMVALNQILKAPNAFQLLQGDLKEQIKDLWLKLKASGLTLEDPPILFGLPANFSQLEEGEEVEEKEEKLEVPVKMKKKSSTSSVTEDNSGELPH
jgi:hypothetical protein